MSDREVIIRAENIDKSFPLRPPARTALSYLTQQTVTVERKDERRVHAVRDISLSVERGQVCGIIGRNGAGKTTLLQLLAGILQPDKGSIERRGKVLSLLGTSSGLRQQLTVKDNIMLLSALFGMSYGESKETYDDILDFAGLHEYTAAFPYQLSSGMKSRLGFSIAIHAHPDILILDEVFAVGDMHFREMAEEKMKELIARSGAVIMAGHQLQLMREYAQNVLWLENGSVRMQGEASVVIDAYKQSAQLRRQSMRVEPRV